MLNRISVHLLMLFCASLALYSAGTARGVTQGDSGDFLLAGLTLGIAHAPGYPLYTLLAHAFSKLCFFLDPPHAINLLSAGFAAATLALHFLCSIELGLGVGSAWAGALALGFATPFWRHAGVAEVYTLQSLLIVTLLYLALRARSETQMRIKLAFWLLVGLGVSNHYPLTLLSLAGILPLVSAKKSDLASWAKASPAVLLGLTPYAYLLIQAARGPQLQYNFSHLSSPSQVWSHFLRTDYQYETAARAGVWADRAKLFLNLVWSTVGALQLPALCIPLGAWAWLRDRRSGRRFATTFLIGATSTSVLLLLLLSFPDTARARAHLEDFTFPVFIFLSFFVARSWSLWTPRVAIALFLMLTAQAVFNFPKTWQRGNHISELWARATLASVQPGSILVLCGPEAFAYAFVHDYRGFRPDVTIYDHY
ncbi:MAG: DUF2723 domain-containing protein, partial [Bdellovibrionota bacterium]